MAETPIKAPKKPRRLSKKAKGFAKDYALTGNGTQAALKHYDTTDPHVAQVIASENLSKPVIMEEITRVEQKIADRIPDDLLVEKHIALLNKKEVKRTFNHETGEWIEIETGGVETQAVAKGLELAYKIKKMIGADDAPPRTPAGNTTYINIFAPQVQERVKAIDAEIKQALMQPKNVG